MRNLHAAIKSWEEIRKHLMKDRLECYIQWTELNGTFDPMKA